MKQCERQGTSPMHSMREWRLASHGVGSIVLLVVVGACGGTPAMNAERADGAREADALGRQPNQTIERDVARIRAVTEPFKSLDTAVAAGYARNGGECVDNPPEGAMGYHHQNTSLLDDEVDVERPEMLVYERMADGEYRLNGVEYIVPFTAWPSDRQPPTVMGQNLKPAPSLGIWYRHVWVWRENPSGLFADWHPLVKC